MATEKEQQQQAYLESCRGWYNVLEDMMQSGVISPPAMVPAIQVAHARGKIVNCYSYMLNAMGECFTPMPEIDQLADWLTNNHHKGLILYGPCGRGKTFLARYVIPMILWSESRIQVDFFNSADAIKHTDDVLKCKYCVIDDVGTEGEFVEYGTRRKTIDEAMDAVEKKGNLLILTSNLHDGEEFRAKYGDRFYDRMMKYMHCICFRGQSFRNPSQDDKETTDQTKVSSVYPGYTNNPF